TTGDDNYFFYYYVKKLATIPILKQSLDTLGLLRLFLGCKIRAKKHFGQNFLTDSSVVDKIIKAMPDTRDISLVEVGPGLGDLTKGLIERGSVEAYEVDEDLYEHLKDVFKEEIQNNRLRLNLGDVLEYWERGSLPKCPYWIVANIPYYITTPIIHKGLEDTNCIGMILMVQKEVAEKLTADVSSKEYSSLSVLVQILSRSGILFEVPSEAFNPPPKVTSAVVRIEKKDSVKVIFQGLKRYVSRAFAAPRKTLLKNLSSCYNKEQIKALFEKLNISPNLRPHELTADMHLCLFRNLTI
ncbi:MAG: 16S rRNA (adenine(1518)-N(6)/adenine(1519)-N(6))-dimethyltransferase RsmA, partial [Campylobacteraceae bacterium]|nr:16S rRNA (adenine(1518)-N(6)/adenine(1519)-N(6))-dimethyltransferase RsmA [Campylobacteraceae bacterium]